MCALVFYAGSRRHTSWPRDWSSDVCSSDLNPLMCPCLTMNRIDLPHLLWALESISGDEITNQITVEETVAEKAMLALTKMLRSEERRVGKECQSRRSREHWNNKEKMTTERK